MVSIKVSASRRFKHRMSHRQAKRMLRKAIKVNGQMMYNYTQRYVPVRTGELRRSLTLVYENRGLTARVYTTMYYADFVEHGTRLMSAQPYMAPAFRKASASLLRDVRAMIKKSNAKAKKSNAKKNK